MQKQLLVIGARPNSLGEAVVQAAEDHGIIAITTGLGEGENGGNELDITRWADVEDWFGNHFCPNVVCTVGINLPDQTTVTFAEVLEESMMTNAVAVLALCHEWIRHIRRAQEAEACPSEANFVVISSNSAHIARSGSVAYCASKAALSMGIRCLGRREANDEGMNIWGYEPGWIDATPMSVAVASRPDVFQLHRIPGNRALDRDVLAKRIVDDLKIGYALNGCMIRIDGGEQ